MRTEHLRRLFFFSALLAVCHTAAPAAAQCPSAAPDLPDACPCAGPSVSWPVPATPGDVVDTALELAGVVETCDPNRGQPYWQLQMNYASSQDVLDQLASLSGFLTAGFPAPRPWSTEFVSHVFAQAGVPYGNGLDSRSSASRYPRTPEQLMQFFVSEQALTDLALGAANFFDLEDPYIPVARGRWIDGSELSLRFFQPGENGPCPGAVQIVDTRGFIAGNGFWLDRGHAQIVGDMVVYRDATGKVVRIDAQLIQGDAPSGATHANGSAVGSVWVSNLQNLQRYTVLGLGQLSTAENRKIRGWGIPRDETGAPIYDPSRITYVDLIDTYPLPYDPTGPDPETELMASPYLEFAQERGGVTIIDKNIGIEEYMPSPSNPWEFPADDYGFPPQVEMDLLLEWPQPIQRVMLYWKNGQIPESLTIELEDGLGNVIKTTRTQDPVSGSMGKRVAASVRLDFAFDSAPMQKLRLILPPSLPATYELERLDFEVESGADDYDQFDPQPTAIDPRRDAIASVVAWASDRGVVTDGVVEASARIRPGTAARLRVFDLRGRELSQSALPVSGELERRVRWDGRDATGRSVARGVYFLRLEADGMAASKRVMMLR